MAFPSLISNFARVLLHYLAVEFLVFLAAEFLVRIIFQNRRGKTEHIQLLITQEAILLASSLVLHLLHHAPFFLIAVVIFIFCKGLHLAFSEDSNGEYWVNGRVSKPLQKSLNDMDSSTDVWNQEEMCTYSNASTSVQQNLYRPQAQLSNAAVPNTHNSQRSISHAQILTRRTGTQVTESCPSSAPAKPTHYALKLQASLKPNRSLYQGSMYALGSTGHSSSTIARQPLSKSTTPAHDNNTNSSIGTHWNRYLNWFPTFKSTITPSECPPGIRNAGNTCFVNSTLQSLARTPAFLAALADTQEDDTAATSSGSNSALLKSLRSLLQKCCVLPDGKSVFEALSATEFLSTASHQASHLVVSPSKGKSQSQQDASEFLLWLLDALHSDLAHKVPLPEDQSVSIRIKEELRTAKSQDTSKLRGPLTKLAKHNWSLHSSREGSSAIHDLFLGQIVEARECQECSVVSANVEYFTVLSLHFPNTTPPSQGFTLKDCFNNFGSVEDLDSSNMMACPHCYQHISEEPVLTMGKRIAMLSHLPRNLILQLARFSYDRKRKAVTKNTTPVLLPLTIDAGPYLMESKLSSQDPASPNHYKAMEYKLYAFCIHMGAESTCYGHYVAYCLASNDVWYCCNDKYVYTVEDIQAEMNTCSVLQNAYLLFYTRILD